MPGSFPSRLSGKMLGAVAVADIFASLKLTVENNADALVADTADPEPTEFV